MAIKYSLPTVKGPGFNSTPDIIKSVWVTLDSTNRYDNKTKVAIMLFVFKTFPDEAFPMLQVMFLFENEPILDLY